MVLIRKCMHSYEAILIVSIDTYCTPVVCVTA